MTLDLPDGVVCRLNEPMAAHSPWRVGGPVAVWLVVHRESDLVSTLSACKKERLTFKVWGAGTQTLVRSGGLAGALVRLGSEFSRVLWRDGLLVVGASAPMAVVASAARRHGLTGLEEAIHSMGSAAGWLLRQGGGVSKWVTEVRYVHRGAIRVGTLSDVLSHQRVVVGFSLRLDPAEPTQRRRLERRAAKRGPDSWLSKPKGRRSLRAILHAAGVAGVRLRSVALTRDEPEVFVNLGGALSEDFTHLQRSVIERVKVRTGVELSWNVRWLGKRSV